jgi:hypothetical protein
VRRQHDRRQLLFPGARRAGTGPQQVLVDKKLLGLLGREPADRQAADLDLARPPEPLPLQKSRAGDGLQPLNVKAGAEEQFFDLAPRKKPQVRAVQEAGRFVGPVALQQAGQHAVVPDVGQTGDQASLRRQELAQLF